MFDRVLNTLLRFHGIAILNTTFVEGLFILKFQLCVCNFYCQNCGIDDFLGIFQKKVSLCHNFSKCFVAFFDEKVYEDFQITKY